MLDQAVHAAVEDLDALDVDAHVHQVADVLVGYPVKVRLVPHVALRVHQPDDHVARVVRPRRQRLQVPPLLGEHLLDRPLGHRVRALVRLVARPPSQHLAEFLQAVEVPPVEQVQLGVPERPLDLALVPATPPRRDVHRQPVVGGEVDEAQIEDRPVALPAVHHPRHRVGHPLLRHPAEVLEALLQAVEHRGLLRVFLGPERPPP